MIALLLATFAHAEPAAIDAGGSPVTVEGNATVTTSGWSSPAAVFGGIGSALALLVTAGVFGPRALRNAVKEAPLPPEQAKTVSDTATAVQVLRTVVDERTIAINKRLDESDRKRELHGNALVLIMNKLGINGPHETLKQQIEAQGTGK